MILKSRSALAAERLYAVIAEEEDARLCADLPDSACREVPHNFFRILASQVASSVADALSSPRIVLTWLLGALGTPAAIIAMLVPVREAGSLVPQLLIGAWVRRHARRARFHVMGSIGQAISVLAMAAAAAALSGTAAGLVVLAALVAFSLARGLCSVAMKDVQGKCIPRQRRGRLGGLADATGGTLVVLLGLWLFTGVEPDRNFYVTLLIAAAVLWLMAAWVFSTVEEHPGETDGGRSLGDELKRSGRLLADDAALRRFVLARAALMGSGLAAPFLVVLAQDAGNQASILGALILAGSLASSLASSVWGWMADRSSRRVMILAGAIAAGCCLGVAALAYGFSGAPWLPIAVAFAYFILSVAHAGVRIGRKTYLVDMAGGNRRTDYVAVSNTAIGFALIAVGLLSGLASLVSVPTALAVLGVMGLGGVVLSASLDEVEH